MVINVIALLTSHPQLSPDSSLVSERGFFRRGLAETWIKPRLIGSEQRTKQTFKVLTNITIKVDVHYEMVGLS